MSDQDFERQFSRASELVDLGRHAQATEILLRLLRDHPEQQAPTLLVLALAHQGEGRRDEALAAIRQSIALQPDAPGAHHVHAALLRENRRPREALASADEAVRLAPEWSSPHQQRAQILSDLGQPREAFDAANEAVRLDPEDADAHFSMGYAMHDANPAVARQAYQAALELNPQHTGALHNLGGLHVTAGDYDAGVRGLADVLAASPQTKLPVTMLDQLIVELIQRWHLITLLGLWFLIVAVAGIESLPVPPLPKLGLGLVFLVGFAAVLARPARRRLGPIRANLPRGGGRFLRGFARRERLATVWLCCIVLIWVAAVVGFLIDVVRVFTTPTQTALGATLLPASPGIPLLLVGAVLSWIRVPLARRRIERDRLM